MAPIHELVPPVVKAALEERLSGQLVLGVTGPPGAGKSTLCAALAGAGVGAGVAVHHVDVDRLAHAVLEEPGALPARTCEALVARFGAGIADGERAAIERAIARGRFGALWTWDGGGAPPGAGAAALLAEILASTGFRSPEVRGAA
jgi:predicted ATPase